MRKMFILCFTLAFLASCAGVANAVNLLTNGSLDLPGGGAAITGWNKDESKTLSGPASDLITLEPWIEVGVVTNGGGDNDFGGFVKAFQGNNTTGDRATLHLYQDVASAPGVQYSLTGYFNAGASYSGLIAGSPTQTLLSIEFDNDAIYDNGGDGIRTAGVDYISIATTDVKAAGLVAGGGPGMPGQQFSVTGTSPAGTLFARAKASMVEGYNPNFTPNPDPSMFIDDFSLDVVPEPATAMLAFVGVFGALGVLRRR
jgi:hypothetical protein